MTKRFTTSLSETRAREAIATPDERYLVINHRLWRRSNPALPPSRREQLVADLMRARRAVGVALKKRDLNALAIAHKHVDELKALLGERGPVWWTTGEKDFNRRLVKNTPYAVWYAEWRRSQA